MKNTIVHNYRQAAESSCLPPAPDVCAVPQQAGRCQWRPPPPHHDKTSASGTCPYTMCTFCPQIMHLCVFPVLKETGSSSECLVLCTGPCAFVRLDYCRRTANETQTTGMSFLCFGWKQTDLHASPSLMCISVCWEAGGLRCCKGVKTLLPPTLGTKGEILLRN